MNGIFNGNLNHRCHVNDNEEFENTLKQIESLRRFVPDFTNSFNRILNNFTEFIQAVEKLDQIAASVQRLKSEHEKKNQELEMLKEEREIMEKQCEIDSDCRVDLDVGGQKFATTVHRLTKGMDSPFFTKLINERWRKSTNNVDNPIFIDRDGRLFDYILKYLRTGQINIDDKRTIEDLLTEAKFYGFKRLADELSTMLSTADSPKSASSLPSVSLFKTPHSSPKNSLNDISNGSRPPTNNSPGFSKAKVHPAQTASSWRSNTSNEIQLNVFIGSNLLNSEYEEKLLEFLGTENQQFRQQWNLIYRASEHGFDAANFHQHCDSHAPTISIIQSDIGNIFGGYTAVPWSSAEIRADHRDPTAFLFTLKSTINCPASKFPISPEHEHAAISQNPTCGPNFGSPNNEGSDICLRNKFNEKTNCIFFPKSYIDTTGKGGPVFGKRYFACKEIEVFSLK